MGCFDDLYVLPSCCIIQALTRLVAIGLLQPAYIVIHPATDNTVHAGKWKAPLEEVMLSGTRKFSLNENPSS